MLFVGMLRLAGAEASVLTPLSDYATALYIAVTVGFIILWRREGVGFGTAGFNPGLKWSHVVLAAAGVAALQLSGAFVDPVLESALGSERDLSRFSGVQGSFQALLVTLALSWTFAAFGEEIAFRIVMLRGIAVALGESRVAFVIAVVLQAVVFGFVHLYQGPVGAASATISGLVFGILTVAARGSIWPAAIAHGTNNTIGLLALHLS